VRAILFCLAALAACTPAPPPPIPGQLDMGDEVLVTVNGKPVTQRLIDIGVRPMPQAKRDALLNDPERKRDLIDSLAFGELLYQRAVDEKLYDEPDVRDAIALAEREILANMMLERIGQAAVTDQAVQERYEAMAVQFKRPGAKVQHLLVKRQDEAEQIVNQIKAGELDLLEAAKRHSIDRSVAQTGGDLGWTVRPPARELQDAWENAPLGEVIGPIEGRLGFHIVKIVDRRDTTPLVEVRDQLAEMIKVEAMQAARPELMNAADVQFKTPQPPAAP
jgi:peptidyl-prolyl cis-trans isomerase C